MESTIEKRTIKKEKKNIQVLRYFLAFGLWPSKNCVRQKKNAVLGLKKPRWIEYRGIGEPC
jgi:hypothetical protein